MTDAGTGRRRWLKGLLAVLLLGLALLLLRLALVVSWGYRPHAPALADDPVYLNDREGFRFMMPEGGWHQYARADLLPGKLDQEQLLVQYRRLSTEQQATLEVSAADLPPANDLTTYLAGPAYGAREWRPEGKPTPVEINGMPGTRYAFTARGGKGDLAREVLAFRRGQRVYFFTLVYAPKDTSAREQFRRSVDRLLWK